MTTVCYCTVSYAFKKQLVVRQQSSDFLFQMSDFLWETSDTATKQACFPLPICKTCLVMPFVLQRCPLTPHCLLFVKYFPGVIKEALTTPRNLFYTSLIPQACILPNQLQAQADMRTGTPQHILYPRRSVTPQYPISSASSCIRTRLPLPATCMQIIITPVRKPNHHLTMAITLTRDTHSRDSQRRPVVSLPWTTTREQPSNVLGVAAVVSLWGNILPKAGVATGVYDSTVSSSSYYTKFLIIFQDSSRTGS